MKTLRPMRRIEWDILESRRCPSLTVPFPAADQPVEHLDSSSVAEHAINLAAVAAGQASNVVFLGDSITQFFQQEAGASVWSSQIAPLGAADLGVAGDTTNNLLWRLENGELAGQPRVAVLLIGTYTLNVGESVAQTVAGIEADIAAIHSISPRTEILLNGIFPRGLPTDQHRPEGLEVNAELSNLASSLGVIFSDPGVNLLTADGSIEPNFLNDLIHPNASGYEIWANGIVDTIREMLSTTTTAPVATTTSPLASMTDTDAVAQASPPSIAPASLSKAPTISPTQGAASTLLDAPPSVSSTPSPVTLVADPGSNVVPSVSVGHTALLRVAQATSPAQQTSDPADDHLG
jgi:lysophospholipase L1-like esterase